MAGVVLGVGLFCAVLFFVDGLSSSMTQQALKPLPIDMQRVLTDPAGEHMTLRQDVSPYGPATTGDRFEVTLTLANHGRTGANEVVVRSRPMTGLSYVSGSGTIEGTSVAAAGGGNPFASGPAGAGLNVGTVEPGTTVVLEYAVEATEGLEDVATSVESSWSSRETIQPVMANAAAPLAVGELAALIDDVGGVAVAQPLSFVDLAPGALSAGGTAADAPVRVFGFDPAYAEADHTVEVVKGSYRGDGSGLVSAEAAAALGVSTGDRLTVDLPDGSAFHVRVGGVADLHRARSLFASRKGADLEAFVYMPFSVVVDQDAFTRSIVPVFDQVASDRTWRLLSPPVHEVDIRVDRRRLAGDPATALDQTARIAARVRAIAPGQDFLLDNISNTLTVARDDAAVAKNLFVFLGVPGALLAAMLAGYAGNVLAEAQRRERAILRIRGANREDLLIMLAIRVTAVVAAGSVLGVTLGYLAARAVVGATALHRAPFLSLLRSGAVGAMAGLLATGTALYVTGRRSIDYEINKDRSRLGTRVPVWRRKPLDVIALAVVTGLTIAALRGGWFEGRPGSVYSGLGVQLSLPLLVLPIGAWVAGMLLAARLSGRSLQLVRGTDPKRLLRLRWGLYRSSVGRRPWAAAQAAMIVGLVVALSVSLTSFTSSYDTAKAADARFTLGGDLRVTPAPGKAAAELPDVADVRMPAVASVSRVVYAVHNSVLRSQRTSELASTAAVEPEPFARIATLEGSRFTPGPDGGATLRSLRTRDGVALSDEMADFLQVDIGDSVNVLLARGTKKQVEVPLEVIARYDRLPGFPDGADALIPYRVHVDALPSTTPSFYLLSTIDRSGTALDRAARDLSATGPVRDADIETRRDVLLRDQSTLAALNLGGLVDLDGGFALAMSVTAVGVFVFGLLLHRRREYVTLRAQGLSSTSIRAIIIGETATAGGIGVAAGTLVGLVMSAYFIAVLRPLFIRTPALRPSPAGVAIVAALVLAAVVITSMAATRLIGRLRADELLRDE